MKQEKAAFYKKSGYWAAIIIISVLAALVLYLNMELAKRTDRIWVRSEGQLRLSNITSGVENNLVRAENYVNSCASQLELLLREQNTPEDKVLYDFIHAQNKMLFEKTEGQCFSTYVAYNNKLYIEDFVPDSSFHLSERMWYVGAKKNAGSVYITAPYIDANTGSMCYSVSVLLDDGETIVGLDFYMDAIQKSIEQMNEQIEGISMIVNEGGMIVGHNDAALVGQNYTVLREYRELIQKVFNLYGEYFEFTVPGDRPVQYTVFSDKTTYGWYLIVCLPSSEIASGAGENTFAVNTVILLFWLGSVLAYTYFYRQRLLFRQRLTSREILIRSMSGKLQEPVAEILRQVRDNENGTEEFRQNLGTLAEELQQDLEDIASFQSTHESDKKLQKQEERLQNNSSKYKRYSMAIIGVLLGASVISVAVNTYTQFNYIDAYMENTGEVFYSQTKSWIDTNTTLTNDLALHMGAQPELYKDYDKAVKYLNDVVKDNEDISVAYIVNPAWEHAVIMNNGWESDDPDWHVEERQWYVDTILSDQGFNISTPYQDEQTGIYCVTFSQIVYDEKGNIVGLIGIDFYMDKLIKILGESYTAEGYAFLTDPAYIILNHPSADYQMTMERSVSAALTEYRGALVSEKLTMMKDYDRRYVVALAKREPTSGFTVVTVRDAWLIYGTLILTDIGLVLVFLASILFVLIITRYMSRQQEEMNQELRVAADKAIAAGMAKSRFLAQMSHEIRTPINAVLGMNELILREAKEEAILNYASNAYNAGNALLSIINDVLDISKIEADKLEIVESEYDMYSLVSDCYHMTADRAAKKGLRFTLSVEETLPSRLYGDMFHLRQIVVNFLTNAIKYTNEGSVELRFERKDTEDGFALKISVTDTGIGLSEESKERLFTSFQRFDLERNQSVEGTGLGLSICKQLAELMGGTVSVESVYGKGSTFACVIPQKILSERPVGVVTPDRQAAHRNAESGRRYIAPTARVLVVDDVEMNLIVFAGLVKGHQFTVDRAQSGKKCLELIQKEKYDIIFMDHMMPEMDGVETYAKMREMTHLNTDTPVIMLTANAISGEKEKYMAAGFYAYLTKPIQNDRLEELLLRVLPEEKLVWQESEAKEETNGNNAEGTETGPEQGAQTDSPQDPTGKIDVKLGLSYAGDDEESYQLILANYVRDGAKKKEEIAGFFAREDWKEYVIRVHALKSTSLTIGAGELSEAAKELELAGKAQEYDTIRSKNEALLEMYREVLKAGEGLLTQFAQMHPKAAEETAAKERETEEISGEKLRGYAERVKNAAENFDQDEILFLCEELSGYRCEGVDLQEKAGAWKEAAENFEYEQVAQDAGLLCGGV